MWAVWKTFLSISFRELQMATASFFVYFSMFYVFFLNFVDSKCPNSFPCGNLGDLEFPLADHSQPECGLFTVECDARPFPLVHPDNEWLSPSYEIVKKISTNQLLARNPLFEGLLNSKSCSIFGNFSTPHYPYISFSFFPNLTLFQCNKSVNNGRDFPEYYRNNTGCRDFDIYFAISSETFPAPNGCEPLPMPIKSGVEPNNTDLFNLLSSEYNIGWMLTDDCLNCQEKGGRCTSTRTNEFRCEKGKSKSKSKIIPIAGSIAGTVVIFLMIVFAYRCRKNVLNFEGKTKIHKDIELFLETQGSLPLRRYKYSDLRKMTNSFSDKLGEGGFASVYRGKLKDGVPVAVKILKESKGNGEEFINEVASISRTSHVNVVKLLGFSFKGSKRALIYEFMPNGSLERFLHNKCSVAEHQLGWEVLFRIAVSIARGIEYLHQGCNTRILHFDIKPHNILLDKDFNPKISDFGLAKLCPNRSSIVSMLGARGTIGYIAPEIVCRNIGEISHKSDVYSYGMMLLEIVGEKNVDVNFDHSSETYFPHWIYKHLEQNAELDLSRVVNQDEHKIVRKMIIIGLWCIQTDPAIRPPMTRVLEMLEGNTESLQIPPKPFFSSPPRAVVNSLTSDTTSALTDV